MLLNKEADRTISHLPLDIDNITINFILWSMATVIKDDLLLLHTEMCGLGYNI